MAIHLDGPCLVVTVGPAASGKSTVLRRLQADGRVDRVVSTDAIRAELGLDPAETRRTYALAHARVRAALDAGEVVAVDATHVRRRDRETLLALAAPYPAVALRVGAGLDLAELVRRDAARDRHVPPHALASKLAEFRSEGAVEVLRAEPFAAVLAAEQLDGGLVRCGGCACPGVVRVGDAVPAGV